MTCSVYTVGLVYVFRANHLFLDSWGDWRWKTNSREISKNPSICHKRTGSVCHLAALNANQQSSSQKDAEVTAEITIKLGRKVVYKWSLQLKQVESGLTLTTTKLNLGCKKLSWKYRAILYQPSVCRLWLTLWAAPNSLKTPSSTFFILKVSAYRLH